MTGFVWYLSIFVLAAFVGYEVVSKVPSILHTPLMSGSNAIHGIVLVGALFIMGEANGAGQVVLGFVAVFLATLNIVGGFVVTDRMLEMFRGGPGRGAPGGGKAPRGGAALAGGDGATAAPATAAQASAAQASAAQATAAQATAAQAAPDGLPAGDPLGAGGIAAPESGADAAVAAPESGADAADPPDAAPEAGAG